MLGAHIIVTSTDAQADRAKLAELWGFDAVDAGDGWTIFSTGPSELAVHPAAHGGSAELWFMCEDIDVEVARLDAAGVTHGPVEHASWGRNTSATLPGGSRIGIYQPAHPNLVSPLDDAEA